jgi:hypothetical protein
MVVYALDWLQLCAIATGQNVEIFEIEELSVVQGAI